MRYLAARELQDVGGNGTGKFHYTQLHDGVVTPVGYCVGWLPWMEGPDPTSLVREEILAVERQRLAPFKSKFHTDGHASAEEACECYRQFLLDLRANYDGKLSEEQRKCNVCGEWTNGIASVGGVVFFVLCDKHRNRGELSKLLTVGASAES